MFSPRAGSEAKRYGRQSSALKIKSRWCPTEAVPHVYKRSNTSVDTREAESKYIYFSYGVNSTGKEAMFYCPFPLLLFLRRTEDEVPMKSSISLGSSDADRKRKRKHQFSRSCPLHQRL
ncbi:hypothetical protein ABVK25_007039 [Lepraria finkii]|uniref:Uncharacterized protein n=1 Tax=Lepraria finkii TaxID=1340010 RepID=A0ABR4B4J6_9LECA